MGTASRSRIKSGLWYLLCFLCTIIGLYPLIYLTQNANAGFLSSKPVDLLNESLWQWAFYIHIALGGLALLIGWPQFIQKLRSKYLNWHRRVGRVYVLSVLLSGVSGIYIGLYANGGWVSSLGFMTLGFLWVYSTANAYFKVKLGSLEKHEEWMIYSYALTMAAVTLRIWLPILALSLDEFIVAYKIVAWLCWVPNLAVAIIINNRRS
ncbi:DUF2306 domain-containing protein [Reichenbachiella ulvae]|uniref:DUF2306 domain-containing protein n=1 Tax=Reichenbachiella ulvae TaxID=2980104 RepID=A0ABT3CQ74_9BACT|nr:DUF2306 domain-containing protein [Reichenbachiella ulvae]MCV9385865.1 DUF2306 domain-containing protein [Reichenbachiella ulvae]